MTSVALITAITIAIARLMFAPKSTLVASTVTSVRNSSVPPVASSTLIDATCEMPVVVVVVIVVCRLQPWVSSVDQVEEREQEDPDQVDDVPVQRGVVDRPEVVRREVALDRADSSQMNTTMPNSTWMPCRPVIAK